MALCYVAVSSCHVITTPLPGAGSPSGVLTLRRPVGAYPRGRGCIPDPNSDSTFAFRFGERGPKGTCVWPHLSRTRKRRGQLPAPPPGQYPLPPPNSGSRNCQEGQFILVLQTGTPMAAAHQDPKHKRSFLINDRREGRVTLLGNVHCTNLSP